MGNITIPKPFSSIIHNAFRLRGYEIKEAYVDEIEHNMNNLNGVRKLREFLGVDGGASVCDVYLTIVIHGIGEKKLLLEDKDSDHQSRFRDAKRQIEKTNELLKIKEIKIDFGIICRVGVESPFVTRSDFDTLPPFKRVYIKQNSNPVYLEKTKIPLLYE